MTNDNNDTEQACTCSHDNGDGLTCGDMFDCCDCGGVDGGCGCGYCWSCNACDHCLNSQ